MVASRTVALLVTLRHTARQLQALTGRHQLVARLTPLVAHALALLHVQFEGGRAVTLAHTATPVHVEVEVLVGAVMAVLLALAIA